MTYSAEALGKLAQIADQLNKETDQVKDTIEGLDKALGKMKLGVSVWLDGPIDAGGESLGLGFAKVEDKWRLAVRPASGANGEATALTKASRLAKVRALPHLDEVVAKLTEKAEAILADVLASRPAPEPESAAEAIVEEPADPDAE